MHGQSEQEREAGTPWRVEAIQETERGRPDRRRAATIQGHAAAFMDRAQKLELYRAARRHDFPEIQPGPLPLPAERYENPRADIVTEYVTI